MWLSSIFRGDVGISWVENLPRLGLDRSRPLHTKLVNLRPAFTGMVDLPYVNNRGAVTRKAERNEPRLKPYKLKPNSRNTYPRGHIPHADCPFILTRPPTHFLKTLAIIQAHNHFPCTTLSRLFS